MQMLNLDALSFQEFMTQEPLPLSKIQNALLEFLQGRKDAVLFGAHAVNAYVREPRMTGDVDLFSIRAEELAGELRDHLSGLFHIAIRVRKIGEGRGYRLFQIRKGGNRHLADIRPVPELPPSKRIANVQIIAPAELVASKVIAYHRRRGQPKSGTDWRDLAMLLLAFPELKRDASPVAEALRSMGAGRGELAEWRRLAGARIQPERPDEEF